MTTRKMRVSPNQAETSRSEKELRCPSRDELGEAAPGSRDRISEKRYRDRLVGAEQSMDARFSANACPREKLESFKNLGLLGAGSYGDVYLVEYSKDRKIYALKAQTKCQYEDAIEREGVIREKKLHYALRDDFIVELYFAFQDDVNLYLIIEYAEFGDCRRFKEKRLPENLVKLYAAQLILAIEYIHACSIIHRDIKADNVLIFGDAYLKLADFGVSKKIFECTSTFVGSPAHMAPEIIRSEPYGKGSDWWGLGLFIFELSFGYHPFCRPRWHRAQITDAIVHDEVRFPMNYDLDRSLRSLVLGLLEKDQSKRLGTLAGEVDDLRRHEWFRGISFVDVYNKRIPIQIDLDPVRPEQNVSDRFGSDAEPCNDLKDLFNEF